MSWDNKARLHLPDGPAQRQRDAEMTQGRSDVSFRAWLYAHDAANLEQAA
jgi:hypothetical protein